ncbi:MAG: thiamine pyrophosphate-binding protein [Myxococcales bacterium]|nr:MAG: thiamine pyrophosphate-binding protein [Myxococcales bacterium]
MPAKSLIQLDIDPGRIGRNFPVDVPLVGDAQTILTELVYHVHRLIRDGVTPASVWEKEEPLVRGHQRYIEPGLRISEQFPVTPQRWRCDLEEVLPNDTIIFSDIGGHMLFNVHNLCIKDDQRFIINLGFGSMGHGTVAPIGAALAVPDRPIVAIIGDACFMMNGMEIITAAEENIPVIWIVENNQMHGITWHGSRLVGKGLGLSSVKNKRPLPIAKMAEAMGLRSYMVDRAGQIQDVMRAALAYPGPTLIEVLVDPYIPPPLGDRARSIAGFISSRPSPNAEDKS